MKLIRVQHSSYEEKTFHKKHRPPPQYININKHCFKLDPKNANLETGRTTTFFQQFSLSTKTRVLQKLLEMEIIWVLHFFF